MELEECKRATVGDIVFSKTIKTQHAMSHVVVVDPSIALGDFHLRICFPEPDSSTPGAMKNIDVHQRSPNEVGGRHACFFILLNSCLSPRPSWCGCDSRHSTP